MNAQRGQWNSRFGFVLAAAGSAIGLGNIWKFPFEVGNNGGAAFVVVYLIFTFVLCFPVMVTEIAIGRKTNKNPVGAYTALGFKNWSFVGMLGVFAGVMILSFYNIVAAWAFGYVIEMLFSHFAIGSNFGGFTADWLKIGLYAIIFMGTTAFIVSHGVSAGIERAAKILMPSLIAIMVFLVIYAFTLPNAMSGVEFYLVPDFSKLSLQVIYSALGQAFFSLSLGMGALITYGSYLSKRENIVSSAAFITLADVGIAFTAGLMMFPLVFSQNLPPNGGAGLIFITLPGVFESLGPVLGVVIGTLFFVLLSFAALTSTVSLLEVPVSYAVDELKMRRKTAVWVIGTVIFIVGIPSLLANGASAFWSNSFNVPGMPTTDFMSFIGYIANDSFLPLGGFLISVFAAYVWRKHNLHEQIAIGYDGYEGSFVQKFIDIAISYLAPIILGIVFILTVLNRFFGISVI
jgi:NSS family neurotransmitter:Na+ symporter